MIVLNKLINSLHARLTRDLVRDRRGNVLMIFGLAVIPLTFATGMGIDYGRAMRTQTKMNAIADAASVAPSTQPMMKFTNTIACIAAERMFVTQTTGLEGLVFNALDPAQLVITVTETYANSSPTVSTCSQTGASSPNQNLPLSRIVSVTYAAKSNNTFAKVLGLSTLTIKGSSTAKTVLAPYIDIHMALDTSQSMGLAATNADATALWNATTQVNHRGCQFGCHVTATSNGDVEANSQIASERGIQLRVDVLRESAKNMIQTAISDEAGQQLYQFGLYRIGRTTTDISPLTANLSTSLADVNSLTLGPNDASGYGDSDLAGMATYILPKIKNHGDGTTQDKARAFLFIVTDGVSDLYGGCVDGHCTQPLNAATCKAYKDANITVGIVYTTYLPVYANPLDPNNKTLRPEYTDLIKHFSAPGYSSPNPSDNSADIAPALQACASAGWYFEASDGPAIDAAIQKLFAQATQSPTITH